MHESSTLMNVVSGIIILLIIAATISAIEKKIRVPFTVMLVVVGAVIGMAENNIEALGILRSLSLSPDIILYIFLPTLIFESAFNMNARQLWQNIIPVLTLAVPGLLLSTGIIGGIVTLTTGIPFTAALLLGAILSATDPVAVIAVFKRLGTPQHLTILVEGESLFNDATAIVLATILIGGLGTGIATESLTLTGAALEFLMVFLGGMLVGWGLGVVTSYIVGIIRTDVYIETTLTTILAYASFILAEQVFHFSGVVAVVMAGLTLGNWGKIKISSHVREYIDHFWEYMAYVATALIFLMVGMRVNLAELWKSADMLVWVIFGMLLSRAIVIYGMIPLSNRLPGSTVTNRNYQHVMTWGGLRGVIALAIVLSLPDFPLHDVFIALVMGAVLFTLLVQGLTIESLVRKLGLNKPPLSDRIAKAEGILNSLQLALSRLPEIQHGGLFSGTIADRLQQYCHNALQEQKNALQQMRSDEMDSKQEVILLYLRSYANEQAQYNDLYNKGHLSEAALRSLLSTMASQVDSMRYHGEYRSIFRNSLPVRRLQIVLHKFLHKYLRNTPLLENLRLEFIVINYEEAWGRFHACNAVLEDLEKLQTQIGINSVVMDRVHNQYQTWKTHAEEMLNTMAEQYPEFISAMQERLGMRLILLAQAQAISDEVKQGTIPRIMGEQMEDELYQQLWALRGQEITRLSVEPDELLRKVPFFRHTTKNDFLLLGKKMQRMSVSSREVIIKQGDKGDRLYLIARGVVRISREKDGKTTKLTSLFAGDFFGEMALLHDEVRSATVTSITPCTFYILDRKDVEEVMAQQPSIRMALQRADQHRRDEQEEIDRKQS